MWLNFKFLFLYSFLLLVISIIVKAQDQQQQQDFINEDAKIASIIKDLNNAFNNENSDLALNQNQQNNFLNVNNNNQFLNEKKDDGDTIVINGNDLNQLANNGLNDDQANLNGQDDNPFDNITTTTTDKPSTNDLPPQLNEEAEHAKSWTLMFILSILALSILVIHIVITINFSFLPESLVVIFIGAIIGLCIKLLDQFNVVSWSHELSFPPTMFFLVLLPPIIFESGYNLHKGNFFQNIGSILVFAIMGTAISAFVMGAGIYIFGQLNIIFPLTAKQSFAFGSLVSAVDPVATLAIFNALEMDPILYMLVFGESILNDAIAIVLTNTIVTLSDTPYGLSDAIYYFISKFFLMFFASAFIGCCFGIFSSLLFKYVDVRKTPSLEMALMFIFMYSPYAFAEAIRLSGIMAILFAGVVMSHYTHNNLSSITRITLQQTFRTLSFLAETCVFAYLGLAIFTFKHVFIPSFVISSLFWCLLSRAANIFPLALMLNYFREHKITKKMQFIMWFSGLRGAIAFALSLNLEFSDEIRHVLLTSTLIIVLFTTLVLGGATLPLMKFLNPKRNRRYKEKEIFLSKTKEMGDALNESILENASNDPNSVDDPAGVININIQVKTGERLGGFARFDERFLKPLLIRKFTAEELRDGRIHMNNLTKKWCDEVRQRQKSTVFDENDMNDPEAMKSLYSDKVSNKKQRSQTKLSLSAKQKQNISQTNPLSPTRKSFIELNPESNEEMDDFNVDDIESPRFKRETRFN